MAPLSVECSNSFRHVSAFVGLKIFGTLDVEQNRREKMPRLFALLLHNKGDSFGSWKFCVEKGLRIGLKSVTAGHGNSRGFLSHRGSNFKEAFVELQVSSRKLSPPKLSFTARLDRMSFGPSRKNIWWHLRDDDVVRSNSSFRFTWPLGGGRNSADLPNAGWKNVE